MKVIIAGAGFAGLELAQKLNNRAGIEVMLIDKFNFHQFQPLFYQVATAGLDASNISFPLRKVFQKSNNVRIRLAEVTEIRTQENILVTNIEEFKYDVLVIATGADTNFFNNVNLQQKSFPMKSTVEALQIKYHLIKNLEDALDIKDEKLLRQKLGVVIAGGGPTGVELSGAIAEMRNKILPRDYPEIDFGLMDITLVEGSPRTLAAMSEKSSRDSKHYLEKLGVKVLTQTHVKDYDGVNVLLGNGETIGAGTVIWAAGIKGNVPAGIDPALVVRGNRIKVDRLNRVQGFEHIYALGDVAYMETPKYPHGHPQVANVAINQAKNLAKNLIRQVNGNKHYQDEFEYHDKGSLATVGRNLAVVDFPGNRGHLGGFIAWFIWMALHLVLILGVKNRLQVFVNWVYKYFTYDQSLRLLFKDLYGKQATGADKAAS
ncbi:MAG TPA: NAD(P)/FAD-dependent oxidoreductase [Chitinophagaceae bacterium]|jgi:NADH dehydrogenase|nr:NAD(P)/FAD-dependent oxidoreductase [Chitinophagaceae bacterium]